MRRCVLLLLLAGCNEIYSLSPTRVRDAAITDLPDSDGDGTVDRDDNCPQTPNADQRDIDGDAHGDLCDDCPLIVNTQGLDADGDGHGDLCDPHPAQRGDCLRVVDSFSSPQDFETAWKVAASAELVTVEGGVVRLAPTSSTAPLAILSLLVPDATDVTIIGRAPKVSPAEFPPIVSAFASASADGAYACRLIGPDQLEAEGSSSSLPIPEFLVPRDTGTDRFVVRLITTVDKIASTATVLCRAEYGISVGTDTAGGLIIAGNAGFGGGNNASEIDAVALSRFDPGVTTCPPTIYR